MKQRRRNNQGSTIIIVLLMCSFIMVIATAITMTTLTCLKLKMANRESKKTFYTSEEAVDEVYASLGKISIECFNTAYEQELSNIRISSTIVAGNPISNSYIDNATANIQLRESYTMKLLEALNVKNASATKLLNDTGDDLADNLYNPADALDNFKAQADDYLEDSGVEIVSIDRVEVVLVPTEKSKGGTGYNTYFFKFYNCVVKYLTRAGYYSYITFDGTVGMPDVLIDFVDNDITGTLNFADYCLIGNVGIDVTSGASITGSAFAGKSEGFNALSNGISFTGNKLICAGNINVGGSFSVAGADVYTRGIMVGHKAGYTFTNVKLSSDGKGLSGETIITTNPDGTNKIETVDKSVEYDYDRYKDAVSGTLNVTGSNFYVNDDMEVNGNESTVTFNAGRYFGYGYELASKDASGITMSNRAGKPDASSSVIVNSTKSNVTFNGTDVMISGRAYVTYTNNKTRVNNGQKNDGNYTPLATGEDVSLDVNQEIYMVPGTLVTKGTNPCYTANKSATEEFECNITAENFFGYSLLNTTNPTVHRNSEIDITDDTGAITGTKYYTYYYFNFKDVASLRKYFNVISDGTGAAYNALTGKTATADPLWVAMNAYYNSYVTAAQSSVVMNTSSYSSYLTELVSGRPVGIFDTQYQDKACRYKAFYTLLMPLDGSKNYTSTMVENEITDYKSYCDEYDKNGIYTNFINPDGLDEAVKMFGGNYATTALNNGSFHLIASKNGTYNVPADISSGVIVCSGNVVIDHDFNGVIIANKVIEVKNGVTISNTWSMSEIVNYIQTANILGSDGNFYYYKDIFRYWNTKSQEKHVGTLSLADMTYKDMVTFSEWRKYEDATK